MSGLPSPSWWRLGPSTVLAAVVAVCGFGLWAFDRVEGIHDMAAVLKVVVEDVSDLKQWRAGFGNQESDRYRELSVSIAQLNGDINAVKGQVDAVRNQQIESVNALNRSTQSVQDTQALVTAIAKAVNAPVQPARNGR
jgi:septal ring factor EnvC (AmiA/AmiB activator)